MTDYRRPWWLLVNKSPGLVTTVREEGEPGRRVLVVRGEPVVQGLAWLTWGPVSALVVVFVMTFLAVVLQVQEQSLLTRAVFIIAFLSLPALAWVGTVIVMARISAKYIRAEQQADRQECIIQLDQNRGQLSYRAAAHPVEVTLPFQDIQQVRAAHPIGGSPGSALRLVLDTTQGPVVLLDEALGTQAQKRDLAREIQEAIKLHAADQQSG